MTPATLRKPICLLLLALPAGLFAAEPGAKPVPLVAAVDSIGLTVGDVDRSVAFYADVLSFEKVSDVEVHGEAWERLTGVFGCRIRTVRMRLGDEFVELSQFLAPRGRVMPADSRGNDRWFQHIAIIVSDMDRAYAALRAHKVEHASTGPQKLPEWNPNAAGIEAFYFRDPDGHFLEILAFPEGKGDPKWHRPTDRLFLGIDHTAIVVEDTDESLRLYRDLLGFDVVGGSENHGTEQEHLNNVFGARLRITTLRAADGPAVEFLEYLAPADGRPAPEDTRSSDLWHWQINTRTSAPTPATLGETGGGRVSSEAVRVPEGTFTGMTAALIRDRDGHALLLAHP